MKKQAGFTLIELIAVIVVLGILSAVALPKFVNLSGEARAAKMQGAVGAVNSAAALIHAKWLANGSPTSGTIPYEGGVLTLPADMSNGYPAASVIDTLAGLSSSDFTKTVVGTVATISDKAKTGCSFTYTPPASAGAVPVIDAANVTNPNCQ